MIKFNTNKPNNDATFLPEDYVERRAERRTNLICITLFMVVTAGVVGAFFVTNRQWNEVQEYQRVINIRYTQAAKDIEELKKLNAQRTDLMKKREIAAVLREQVPRSILLAEIINRLPDRARLAEFQLQSKRVDPPTVARQVQSASAGRSIARRPTGGTQTAKPTPPDIQPPRYDTTLVIIGIAPDNRDVAHYVAALHECPLLRDVELKVSELTRIRDNPLLRFRIEARIDPNADARGIAPLAKHRGLESENDPFSVFADGAEAAGSEGR